MYFVCQRKSELIIRWPEEDRKASHLSVSPTHMQCEARSQTGPSEEAESTSSWRNGKDAKKAVEPELIE